ncbi:MAG: sigma-70 family RNA polymerase sigma factor, partial [Actinomycetota bacterium]|nr:sigma-70 family RNA polymerase sigma factor [Actinomycetota bacterium]
MQPQAPSDSPAPESESAEQRVQLRLSGVREPVSASLDSVHTDGSKLDDSYLVQRARAGSTEAFEVLVHRYRDRVFRVALRMVGDRASAEDVAQDALVSAWRGLANFRGDAQFSTWLHRIVLNSALNHVTRRRQDTELTGQEPIDP